MAELRPVQIGANMLAGYQGAQQIQSNRQANELRGLQMQQAQGQMQRDEQFRGALGAYLRGGTNELATLYATDPERAMQVQQFQGQQNQLARQRDVEKAKVAYAQAQGVINSAAPADYFRVLMPDQAAMLAKQMGKTADDLTDDEALQIANQVATIAGSQAGLLPEYSAPVAGQVDGQDVFFQPEKISGRVRVLEGVNPRPQAGGSSEVPSNVREYNFYRSLPTEEARQEYLRVKRGDDKPSSALEKRLFDVNDAAFKSRSNSERYINIASEMERTLPSSGVRAKWTEKLKEITGTEDAVTTLRKDWNSLRVSAAVQNLPPGVASDKDIALVMSAFLPENANPIAIASFMRGLGKLEDLKGDYHEFQADYLSLNKTAVGLGKAWREHLSQQTAPPQGEAAQSASNLPSQQEPAKITSDAEFDALPSGTEFIAPDGTKRRKP